MKHSIYLLTLVTVLMTALSCTPSDTSSTEEVSQWPVVLFAGDYPDPSILVEGDDYYLTCTSNYWLPALPIWHSKDLVNWEFVGNALEKYIGTVWAPDIQKIDGRYVIYFPAGGEIYVVYSDAITGPWSEPEDLGVRAIDPGFIESEDGHRCLYFNGGWMVDLAPDGLSVVGEPRHVYDPWPIPADWVVECTCLESPKLVKHNGWYYLTSAEGGTAGPATSHMAVVHRSRQPEGPWEASPYNPVIHTWSADEEWWSKGHGTLFADAQGQWWMVYHAYRKGYHTLGRHALLEPMTWTSDGWPVVDSTAVRRMAVRTQSGELQWSAWKGSKMLQTAVTGDTCYTFSAHVDIHQMAQGEAGVLLSYNSRSFTGVTLSADSLRVWHEGLLVSVEANTFGSSLYMKIVNDRHQVRIFAGTNAKTLQQLGGVFDVSGMHHNKLGSFMSLRPALQQPEGAVIDNISYKPSAE